MKERDKFVEMVNAASKMATDSLQRMNKGGPGATILSAKMQARIETFRQTLEWYERYGPNAPKES